jgi:acetyltransferase-like isoleucine patch superfamily enzyme
MRLPFLLGRDSSAVPQGVTIGRHTYGHDLSTFPIVTEGARIAIGAFCSISPGVRILGGGEHIIDRVSTFPMNARLLDRKRRNVADALDKGPTVIGNDVWLGLGAIVLSGITVGDGAVIGAGAVVKKSVPPYAVAVGNPAAVIRYRFDSETRQRLLDLEWWNWTDEQILARADWFMADVASFLTEMERTRPAA